MVNLTQLLIALPAPEEARWALVTVDAPGWVEPEPRQASRGRGTVVIRAPRRMAWCEVGSPIPPGLRDWTTYPADARAIFPSAGDDRWPELKVILERGAAVRGTVETEAGAPVSDAIVTAFWQDDLPGWRSAEARADGSHPSFQPRRKRNRRQMTNRAIPYPVAIRLGLRENAAQFSLLVLVNGCVVT